MRTFIAIDLADNDKKTIFDIAQSFKKYCKGTFVRPDLYHITLFFFGDISEKEIKHIENILKEVEYSTFMVKLIGIDCFYNNKRPRVCFVKGESELLKEMFTLLQNRFIENQISWDKKPLKIHSTFLRIREVFDYEGFKINMEFINKNFSAISFTVNKVILYNSKLSSNGSEYYKYFVKNLKEVN